MIVDHALIAVAALIASGITFFSGFGLGTALLPAFAAFLPTEVAVGMVAIVHLLNNGLKFGLLRGHVDRRLFLRFGIPGIVTAPIGALLLRLLADVEPLATYAIGDSAFAVTPVNVVIALLLALLGIQELMPSAQVTFPDRYLVAGGAVSGLLGGLAGLQGALRSAFLIRAGLDLQTFLATGVAVALVVDLGRIVTYAAQGSLRFESGALSLAITGLLAASAGAIVGNRLLHAVTIQGIRILVGVMLVAVAVALGAGLI